MPSKRRKKVEGFSLPGFKNSQLTTRADRENEWMQKVGLTKKQIEMIREGILPVTLSNEQFENLLRLLSHKK